MIAAVQPCSFVDFPGRLAAVAFTQGCNLRCRYCHNPALCEQRATGKEATNDFLRLLARRRHRLAGVVICGGEPTLWQQLAPLLHETRSLGYAIKLDSNGTRPKIIARLIEQGLVDYLAVDVKGQPGERSRWLCGDAHQAEPALDALAHAVRRGVACEARTVLVRGIHDHQAMTWLTDALAQRHISRWRLSPVEPGRVLDPSTTLEPPETSILQSTRARAQLLSIDVIG